MPVFTFSGKDASGQKISGERNAPNKQALGQQLRRERITPGSIREKGKEFAMPTFGSGKVKTKDIAIFFRQFSVMIDAGLPLVQCQMCIRDRRNGVSHGPDRLGQNEHSLFVHLSPQPARYQHHDGRRSR